ncbi:homocysteine S-methyltransferase family protein [Desulfofalx alkaliphila]|uniref:homocysteine S-methyltransferase family protein n=1 Tax=Desulfofalx alkaliphila TaxID=105483 RepID=UPI0004E0D4EC|nr:homocysteine S-methyltransferase family protein [Desulfofalx alkaliphila]
MIANKILVFDGAMGTMLQKHGLLEDGCPELLNVEEQQAITDIHRKYVAAGANVIETNTFGGNRIKLAEFGLEDRTAELNAAGVKAAKAACDHNTLVALSVGPTGKLMQPSGPLTFNEAYQVFKEQITAGISAGADVICIETMSDLGEARAAVLAAKDAAPHVPVICCMTFQPEGRTLMGTDPVTAVIVLQSLGTDVVGANCSGGPEELRQVIADMYPVSKVPLLVQPNAGLPVLDGDKTIFPLSAEEMGAYAPKLVEAGASLVGSCCGSTPDFTGAIKNAVAGLTPPTPRYQPKTYVTSSTRTLVLGSGQPVRIIGERINPTGKKALSEELRRGTLAKVVQEAVQQVENGADLLDVNVGLPDIDEAEMLVRAVNAVQKVVNVPLQIDSTNVQAVEAALQAYHGKALLNSVNGKEESLSAILPLVKRYGACVLGLCLNEKGIPPKAEERLEVARRIVERAAEYGIPKEDVLIDCLVLTASAQQEEVIETIKAVQLVKEHLGVATVLGVSNVSFGLPNRGLLNSTFLAMALAAGLDAPILNPHHSHMVDTVRAAQVLTYRDVDAKQYIPVYTDYKPSTQNTAQEPKGSHEMLYHAVVNGIKDGVTELVEQNLADGRQVMDVVDKVLVAALDEVGKRYESGEFFLPQLMQSAEVVQIAFNRLRQELPSGGVNKGTVVLATVKGDIHDIGKNIVKVLMENYGYNVIDLGKDVAPEAVVKATKESDAKLVGLSALMTTTIPSMKETIVQLKEANLDCKVMVGGAVLNQRYADLINAHYYARDAREGVQIAQQVYKQ